MRLLILLTIATAFFIYSEDLSAQEDQSVNPLLIDSFYPQSHQPIIIVKFKEGKDIRLRNGRLVSLSGASTHELKNVIAGYADVAIKRLFVRPERVLDEERKTGELLSGKTLVDLNLFYKFIPKVQSDSENLLSALRNVPIVEYAYFPFKISTPERGNKTSSTQRTTTPDFTPQQGHLFDPPIGIGAWNVWSLNGGRGNGVKIVDVEQGFHPNHEDLPPGIQIRFGSNKEDSKDHGTATLGVMVGVDNGYGITGICPLGSVDVSSRYLEEGTLL